MIKIRIELAPLLTPASTTGLSHMQAVLPQDVATAWVRIHHAHAVSVQLLQVKTAVEGKSAIANSAIGLILQGSVKHAPRAARLSTIRKGVATAHQIRPAFPVTLARLAKKDAAAVGPILAFALFAQMAALPL